MIHTLHNFLPAEILEDITTKYQRSCGTASFEINNMGRWGAGLDTGSYAPVFILPLDEHREYFIQRYKSVNPIFEKFNNVTCYLHVWPSGSQINFHHDGVNEPDGTATSTIYISPEWDQNWGGLFLYDDAHLGKGWIYPHYNQMVWFVPPIFHATSMISLAAKHPRLSIQLFFTR